MIVQTSRISNSVPFKAEGEISVEVFNEFMRANAENVEAREPLHYCVTITVRKNGYLFESNVHASLWTSCIRCGKRDETEADVESQLVLIPSKNAPSDDEIVLGASDLDVSFLDKEEIDIDHYILESIWADNDSNHLCSPDCQGLCPICGKDLNQGACGCNNQL